MEPIVSILLPVYNGQRYLHEAIRSVLRQEFIDWELLIQDDCSTDETEALVKQYTDPRLIYARNPHNLHIAANINTAFGRSRGRYIQLLGQDDRLLPDCLAVQVRFMEAHPLLAFSFCAPVVIDGNGHELINASHAWDMQFNDTDQVCPSPVALLLLFNYGCLPGNISTVMIRRQCLEKVGGFDSSYRICLDWNLWIRLARVFEVGFVKDRLVDIRSHIAQESRNPNMAKELISEAYQCLTLLEDSLPVRLEKALRWARKKRYGAEFFHQFIRTLLAGHPRRAIQLFKIVRSHDGMLMPLAFWICELPRRITRKAMGKGSIELRAAFDPKWLREQILHSRTRLD